MSAKGRSLWHNFLILWSSSCLEAFLQRQVEPNWVRCGESRAAAQRLGGRLRSWQVRWFYCFFFEVPGWWFLSNYDMLIWKMLKYVGIWWFVWCFFCWIEVWYIMLVCFWLNLFFFQFCFRKWERFQVGASPIGGGCQMSLWRKRSSWRFETEQQKHTGSFCFSRYWWTLSNMLNTPFRMIHNLASPWEMQENWCQSGSRRAILP